MGKFQLAATSLVTALPAGMLAAVIVMYGFLKHVSDMGTVLMVLSGAVLLASCFMALMPLGIVIWAGPKKVKPLAAKPVKDQAGDEALSAASVAEASEADVDVLETSGEAQIVDSDADAVALGDSDIDATTAFTTPASGTDLGADDSEEIVEIEDLDDFATMDEIEDEVILEDDEDEKPKKRR